MSTRRGKFQTCPYVRGRIGIMWGRDGRFANRPYGERRDIEHGRWVLRAGLGDGFPPSSSRGRALRGNTWVGGWRAGLGDGFPPSSSRGRALRWNNGWGCGNEGEHEKGQVSNLPLREGKYRYYVGEGRAVREPPLRRGRKDGGRMALRAGLGDGFPPSSSRGQALRGNTWVGMWGEGEHEKGQV